MRLPSIAACLGFAVLAASPAVYAQQPAAPATNPGVMPPVSPAVPVSPATPVRPLSSGTTAAPVPAVPEQIAPPMPLGNGALPAAGIPAGGAATPLSGPPVSPIPGSKQP